MKVVSDHRKGLIVYMRIYSGTLKKAAKVKNANNDEQERPMRLFRVNADDLEDIDEIKAGDIGAAIGLRSTRTGDTIVGLTDKKILFKGLKVPEPVFFCSIISESATQEEVLLEALKTLQLEDPSVVVRFNKETGQLTLGGMGELHLEIVKHRLNTHYKVYPDFGDIYIAYRSTVSRDYKNQITKSFVTASGKHESTTYYLSISPNNNNKNEFKISKQLSLDSLGNKKFVNEAFDAMKLGSEDAFSNGMPAGLPFHDITVEVLSAEIEPGTSYQTLRNAICQAILELAKDATPTILEPIMEVKISVDSSHLRNVMSDLTGRRRGQVEQLSQEKHNKYLKCKIPLKELLGYSTHLRSVTKGTGFFSMEFLGYEPIPDRLKEDILRQHGHFDFENY